MIIVIGHLVVSAEDREAHLALSRTAVKSARSMPGCHHFAVSADDLELSRVNVAEAWASRAELDAFRSRDADTEGVDPFTYIREFHVEEFEAGVGHVG